MRISDWSSDVCSSDLVARHHELAATVEGGMPEVVDALGAFPACRRIHVPRLSRRFLPFHPPFPAAAPPAVYHFLPPRPLGRACPDIFIPVVTTLPSPVSSEHPPSDLQSLIPLSYSFFFFSHPSPTPT